MNKKGGLGFIPLYILLWLMWFAMWIVVDAVHYQLEVTFDPMFASFNASRTESTPTVDTWLNLYGTTKVIEGSGKQIIFWVGNVVLFVLGIMLAIQYKAQSQVYGGY